MADAKRSTGTVKWFSARKGYGFIGPDDGGEDFFVHQTEIRIDGFRTLHENQKVEFRVISEEDGRKKAGDVVILAGNYASDSRDDGFGGGGGRGGTFSGGYGGKGGRGGGQFYGSANRGFSGGASFNHGGEGHFAKDFSAQQR